MQMKEALENIIGKGGKKFKIVICKLFQFGRS